MGSLLVWGKTTRFESTPSTRSLECARIWLGQAYIYLQVRIQPHSFMRREKVISRGAIPQKQNYALTPFFSLRKYMPNKNNLNQSWTNNITCWTRATLNNVYWKMYKNEFSGRTIIPRSFFLFTICYLLLLVFDGSQCSNKIIMTEIQTRTNFRPEFP